LKQIRFEAVRQIRHAAIVAGLQVGDLAHVSARVPLRADVL
jgi:hypothetical protein